MQPDLMYCWPFEAMIIKDIIAQTHSIVVKLTIIKQPDLMNHWPFETMIIKVIVAQTCVMYAAKMVIMVRVN
jgi:hypothetical protein